MTGQSAWGEGAKVCKVCMRVPTVSKLSRELWGSCAPNEGRVSSVD